MIDVRHEGEVLFQSACGLASLRRGVPNTLDIRFDVASITKLFTSVAVLQLVAAGRLDLDASIHEYADLASTAIAPAVELRHLLTHTSGIADIAEEDEGENYAEVFRVVPCHTIVTLRDSLPLFANKPPHFAPGSGPRCSIDELHERRRSQRRRQMPAPRRRSEVEPRRADLGSPVARLTLPRRRTSPARTRGRRSRSTHQRLNDQTPWSSTLQHGPGDEVTANHGVGPSFPVIVAGVLQRRDRQRRRRLGSGRDCRRPPLYE